MSTTNIATGINSVHISEFVLKSDLLKRKDDINDDDDEDDYSTLKFPPTKHLRVCCYGSSSSSTPEVYLQEARNLGYLLAKRGHVCVNGAGSFGCMAAMNNGAHYGNGHIVGVVHEMWLTKSENNSNDNGSTIVMYNGIPVRDGGVHDVFQDTESSSNSNKKQKKVHRQIIVAKGDDLQERKRLLVENADALVVLPGGPGTWDELWEMACVRNLLLSTIPIVCVNVNGYYDPFRVILQRAYDEKLTKLPPDELIHFCNTALEAVEYIEKITLESETNKQQQYPNIDSNANKTKPSTPELKHRSTVLRRGSAMHLPVTGRSRSSFISSFWSSKESSVDDDVIEGYEDGNVNGNMNGNTMSALFRYHSTHLVIFAVGFGLGLAASAQRERSNR